MSAPEELNLTEAAGMVIGSRALGDVAYRTALVVWSALIGLPSDEALAYAEELASNSTTTRAAVVPF
jgi:hypothetical protein